MARNPPAVAFGRKIPNPAILHSLLHPILLANRKGTKALSIIGVWNREHFSK
jgi:hypothetical protein